MNVIVTLNNGQVITVEKVEQVHVSGHGTMIWIKGSVDPLVYVAADVKCAETRFNEQAPRIEFE